MIQKIKKLIKKLTINHKIILLLFLLVVFFKIPILNTPYHWDSLGTDIPVAFWIFTHNFSPFPLAPAYTGHPVLFYEVLALFWFIFGPHLWVSHIVTILFSFLGVAFTYLLGSYLYNKKAGLIASILLFFSPLYFAQSGIVQIAIPFTALTVMSIYFAVRDKKKYFILSGICLALMKEPSILILSMIIIYRLFKDSNLNKVDFLKNSFVYLIPIFIFIGWLFSNKIVYGWFFLPRHFSYFHFNLSKELFYKFLLRFSEIFLYNYRWILTTVCVLSLFLNRKKIMKTIYKGEFFLFFMIILVVLLFFSFCMTFLIRYTLILYPLFFIFTSIALLEILKRKILLTGFLTLLLILFIIDWTGNRINECGCDLESNLEYLDMIQTHRQAAKFIEQNFPDSIVLTDWPMGLELSFPAFGYVYKPIKVISRYYTFIDHPKIEDADIVYYSPQKHGGDFLTSKMLNLNLTSLAKFEKNGKITEIYRID